MKIIVLVLLLISCAPRPAPCATRSDDPGGTLLAICRYIRDHAIDVSPADPTKYHIKRVDDRFENGRLILRVFLDCCYLGDVAEIDAETGDVVRFVVGAK